MYLPDHNPPHFHVRYEEYRATIDIQTGDVMGRMPRRALRLVFEWLDLHKDELMANWKMVSYTFFKFIAIFIFIGIQTTLFGHSDEENPVCHFAYIFVPSHCSHL